MGMWQILQQDVADDFVLATGETHSVREFVEVAFSCVGVEIGWTGTGADEKGVVRRIDAEKMAEQIGSDKFNIKVDDVLVGLSESYLRPTEVDLLIGDASKARQTFGWTPETGFEQLVKIMVDADCAEMRGPGSHF